MAKPIRRYISELLQTYREYTSKTYTEMALEFDISISNLYQYRNGNGNPTAATIDKIISQVEENCPKAIEAVSIRKDELENDKNL